MKIEFVDKADVIQICVILAHQMISAQSIIADTKKANEVEQNKIIEKAIQLLYFYLSCEDQCNALQQLIYKQKNLILIIKILFEKSMILQTASILINRLITLIMLSLNQINHEQTKYIIHINERLFFLNINIISKAVLVNI